MRLDRYFDRIAYGGPTAPTLDTLNAIVIAHTQAIPFENVDVLTGRGIDLSEEAIARKLVDDRRGGYCFEQNSLLLSVLDALGFRATSLGARVRYGRPHGVLTARTHLFVRVDIDGEDWLADVGMGGVTPTCAIRLRSIGEQPTPHEPRRIEPRGGSYFHQVRLDRAWEDVCEFTLEEMPPVDRELANWFTSTHPHSYFKNNLMVARALPNGARAVLVNREFTRSRPDASDVRTAATHEELLDTLAQEFGLRFASGTVIKCAGLNWEAAQ